MFVFSFSGHRLPVSMVGARMTTTATGDGLLMTYEKGMYRFKCTSSNSCFFEKYDNELEISREWHILLSVPASLVEDC